MIENITSKIKKYPFQAGTIAGFILCLLLSLIAGLFRDNGRTLSGNIDLIQEDYLRMTIAEYSENNDAELAAWRYKFLGSGADRVLSRMSADSSISAKDLIAFADALEKRDAVDMEQSKEAREGSPANPKRGISAFAKILLALVGVGILAAGGMFLYSKFWKKSENSRWEGKVSDLITHKKPVQMVNPDESWQADTFRNETIEENTMFDLDKMFSGSETGFMNKKSSYETIQESSAPTSQKSRSSIYQNRGLDPDLTPIMPQSDEEEAAQFESAPATSEPIHTAASETAAAAADVLPTEDSAEESYEQPLLMPNDDTEETYEENYDPVESADAAPVYDEAEVIPAEEEPAPSQEDQDLKEETARQEPEETPAMTFPVNRTAGEAEVENDGLLIHFQSRYTLGNDMYDEVFSIEQGSPNNAVFRGECGIGIGETLNNTEPKAVTAFEVWLFDRDDIHTSTQYLLSDFAIGNTGIASRLQAHGLCDAIHKDDVYMLETLSLIMELKVMEVEYGNETEEKRAYFKNVLFDVCVREKEANAG